MAYKAFFEVFPAVAQRETRSATTFGREDLPDAEYGFIEMYCVDPKCDCRRAIIKVISHDLPEVEIATLSYGWDTAAFYRDFLRGFSDGRDATGVQLERLSDQSELAEGGRTLFEEMLQDPEYKTRIERHYKMVKEHFKVRARPRPKARFRKIGF